MHWKKRQKQIQYLQAKHGSESCLSACYSRNEVAGAAPPDRGRLIADVVVIARGK